MSYIKRLFEEKGITQQKLIEDLNVSQPYASAIMNGKKGIGKKLAIRLNQLYGLDVKQLLNPLQDSDENIHTPNAFNAKYVGDFNYPMVADKRVTDLGNGKYSMIVPLIPEYGYAGYASGYKDPEYLEHMPRHMVIVDHHPQGEYLAVETVGESMENWTSEEMAKQSIRDGEIVTGINIPQIYWRSRFHLHKFKDYIIFHEEGILIKRIIAHDVERGIITCHSLNPNKTVYPDFDLDLREVKKIMNIVQPKR